ncbi:SusD/RagB family nutrient-binding outer membrane lipoprotein [Massilibacteroides sp.]|uniref:SusD/RagB family nutrient-binding outer membrane lipoprotein n=1 Tax=Massilibacteroides sp. TaxID=2034766 RepID=UPI0026275989|nr:SusD/RagB family nutrient-binding outer membrane lipoprotein [Massilibacteroides sp.]MDD4514460.1 SusD/RagB family nutrient-binding outer membrane lipoprotein [Massilibacteroides sp.]
MKKIIYICFGLLLISFSACNDYLDINDNPDSPNNTVPAPDLRLRGLLTNFVDSYESSGTRGCWFTGNITKTYGTTSNDYNLRWDPVSATTTWPYQSWFIYTAANINPLIEKATAEEAWYYVGAAKLIHAWGFMTMVDVYGEMPYTEALTNTITPKYDDGETIFNGCMAMLDEAIAEFQKTPPTTATSFASGDIWNGGDPQKWIKLAYGLKARWLNNLSKKKAYDPDAVLAALEKAAQSNVDNTVMNYVNSASENETGIRSLQHQNLGGTTTRITKWYLDLLTNTFTGGSGVEDPRTDLLVPSGQYRINGEIKYVRTKGVDMINSDIRTQAGPLTFDIYSRSEDMSGNKFDEPLDIWYRSTTIEARKGDSIYTPVYSESLSWVKDAEGDVNDDRYIANRYNGETAQIISTGTFYTRADGPGHLMCYPELCFIKAEVLFRKGDKAGALTAYKNGIRAHMELMNEKLQTYPQTVFGKQVIPADKIDAFLNSTAVAQSATDLTMAKIMQQKFIACSYSIQNWNDMRRFNYSAGNIGGFGVVYIDFARPYEFNSSSNNHYTSTDPNNERYWIRRFQQCDLEKNYNIKNLEESNPEALSLTINSLPVWWDTAD